MPAENSVCRWIDAATGDVHHVGGIAGSGAIAQFPDCAVEIKKHPEIRGCGV
jgi:hypothetical protein